MKDCNNVLHNLGGGIHIDKISFRKRSKDY